MRSSSSLQRKKPFCSLRPPLSLRRDARPHDAENGAFPSMLRWWFGVAREAAAEEEPSAGTRPPSAERDWGSASKGAKRPRPGGPTRSRGGRWRSRFPALRSIRSAAPLTMRPLRGKLKLKDLGDVRPPNRPKSSTELDSGKKQKQS